MAYNWKKFMHGLENYGLAMADVPLSALGASNVIKDDMYKGEGGDNISKVGNAMGGIAKTLVPMAANIVAPGSGKFVKMGQEAINKATSYGGDEQTSGYTQNFAYGGTIQNGTELEKQEVLRTPQGQIRQVDAPTHSQGGTGAMNLPSGTNVLSDRLKSRTGKTFAEEGAKYNTEKWEKMLKTSNDPFQKKTAEKMIEFSNKKLTKLYAEQEVVKGNQLGKGYLKMQAENNQMPEGGTVLNLQTTSPEEQMNQYYNNVNPNYNAMQMMQYGLNANLQGNNNGIPPNTFVGPQDPNGEYQYRTEPLNNVNRGSAASAGNVATTSGTPESNNPLGSINPYFGAATAGNFMGSLYDIYRGAKGGDEVNYERINPDLVDYSASRRMATQETNRGFNTTKKAIQEGTGGNAGAYLSNIGSAGVQRDRLNQNMISQSYENQNNTNAQIKNNAKGANAQIQMQESIARQQEKDVASNTLSKGIYNFGNALNEYGNAMELKGNEPILKALIATGDYDFVYGKNKKPIAIKAKQSGKITGFEGLTKQQQKELDNLKSNLPE